MELAAITAIGYGVTATFLFWYIPFITRNRRSWVWLPTRFVAFLLGGESTTAMVVGVFVQVVVPAAAICWITVLTFRILFLA